MHFSLISTILSATAVVARTLPNSQLVIASQSGAENGNTFRIPTPRESAIQARRILHLETIGTLSTVFPRNPPSTNEHRPSDVAGAPIGLMDYFADCEPSSGNPTILAISIATSFKNVDAGSNITLSLRWHPPAQRGKRWSEASLPRFSVIGYLEEIPVQDVARSLIPACFVRYHPDAAWWLPGNRIHESHWVRLVVQEIYWIGGFGDRAYIGWIPLDDWKSVTKAEIDGVRLPGESSTSEIEEGEWSLEL